MGDLTNRKVREYIMKNALQIVISLLLTVLIAIYCYHFKRLESLEGRVWALEQKQWDVEVLKSSLNERTGSIQRQIDMLCASLDKDIARLEGLITRLLRHNGLSAAIEPERPTHAEGG